MSTGLFRVFIQTRDGDAQTGLKLRILLPQPPGCWGLQECSCMQAWLNMDFHLSHVLWIALKKTGDYLEASYKQPRQNSNIIFSYSCSGSREQGKNTANTMTLKNKKAGFTRYVIMISMQSPSSPKRTLDYPLMRNNYTHSQAWWLE